MAYWDISQLAADLDFAQRTQACYATETHGDTGAADPVGWQSIHAWDMAAMPGFGDAYASAVAGERPNPGRDPAVISDSQVLSAVQLIIQAEAEAAGPPGHQSDDEGS